MADYQQMQQVQEEQEYQVNRELLDLLFSKVSADTYPSSTMLDIIERLLTPEDIEDYGRLLMEKISADTYPSMSLIRRVLALQE
jgi:hypothetical protein